MPTLPSKGEDVWVGFSSMQGDIIDTRNMKGKHVLIDFWATWCKPCVKSIPLLGELYSQYKDKGFVLVGVSCDEDKGKVDKFCLDQSVTWPIHFDGKGPDNEVALTVGVTAIPAMLLIGPDGKVVNKNIKIPDLAKYLLKELGKAEKGNINDLKIEIAELNSKALDSGSGKSPTSSKENRNARLSNSMTSSAVGKKWSEGGTAGIGDLLKAESKFADQRLDEFIEDSRSHPLTRDAFTSYLKSQFCEENFLYLVGTHQLLDNRKDDSPPLKETAQEINQQFLVVGAEKQINISSALLKSTLTKLQEAETLEQYREAYAPSIMEIYNLIRTGGHVSKFMKLKTENINDTEKTNRKHSALALLLLTLLSIGLMILFNTSRWYRLCTLPFVFTAASQFESARAGV
eukprot:gb/GEZN01005678.1/.p1 GENE.gb/GEZN01005678.1/~~gb/GEZN01005678.1/.p1  ORF type:complete len:402 (+),score=45.85 gb/GEZN01005678.1/:43-1248(+)